MRWGKQRQRERRGDGRPGSPAAAGPDERAALRKWGARVDAVDSKWHSKNE